MWQHKSAPTHHRHAHDLAVLEELRNGTIVLEAGQLQTPVLMPRLGVGTALGAHYYTSQPSLVAALGMGYRLIDTAVAYRNAHAVNDAIKSSRVPRSHVFLATKLWPFHPTKTKTKERATLPTLSSSQLIVQYDEHVKELQSEYIDLLLLHWPSHQLLEHWKAMLALQARGKARAIGICNVNTSHLDALADAGLPLPSVVQNELSPVQADTRVEGSLEALVSYCDARGIVLMTHTPLRGGMTDQRTLALAKSRAISPPVLLLRYALQRGFSAVFASTSAEHLRANIDALRTFQLSRSDMREMACWRGEAPALCGALTGAVGAQAVWMAPTRSATRGGLLTRPPPPTIIRRQQQQDGFGAREVRWAYPGVPLAPGELDPITRSKAVPAAATLPVSELRAATRVDVLAPNAVELGSIHSYAARPCHEAERRGTGSTGSGQQQRMMMMPCGRLDVVQPCSASDCREWATLVERMRALAASHLDGRSSRWTPAAQAEFKGVQHVVSAEKDWARSEAFHEIYTTMLHEHIRPHLARTVFGTGSDDSGFVLLEQGGNYPMLSRNMHLEGEVLRSRSMLWHWDHVSPTQIKMLLYLTRVDEQHGCMVAMRHNASGQTYKLRGPPTSPFGPQVSTIPKIWIAELVSNGYRPTCLAGPPGTAAIFDPNIVHRGSRPALGNHRDFVLFLFDVVSGASRQQQGGTDTAAADAAATATTTRVTPPPSPPSVPFTPTPMTMTMQQPQPRERKAHVTRSLDPPWSPPQTTAGCLTTSTATQDAPQQHQTCPPCAEALVTLSVLYYEDPPTLRAQLHNWLAWPVALRSRFELLVVDDTSAAPKAAARALAAEKSVLMGQLAVRVLRMLPPRRSHRNVGGGRNLITHAARGCWVVFCDLHYGLSPGLAELVWHAAQSAPGGGGSSSSSSSSTAVYRFTRGRRARPIHPSIVLMRKQLYWQSGGCDEDMVESEGGRSYGSTDGHFFYRLLMHDPTPTFVTNGSWPKLTTLSETARAIEACERNENRGCEAGENVTEQSRDLRLLQRKKQGEVAWSNDYLRFRWSDSTAKSQASVRQMVSAVCDEETSRGAAGLKPSSFCSIIAQLRKRLKW